MRPLILFAALSFSACVELLPAQQTLPLWPDGTPEPAHTTGVERNVTTAKDNLIGGKVAIRYSDVANPTMAFYPAPAANNSGAAALVFPGGGYLRLTVDAEGSEVCTWLNSIGVNCLLVKYRVPEQGHFPENVEDLEDAQQAMRIARSHATEWHLDPKRLGVIGFSAGAHLAAVLSNHADFAKPGAPASPLEATDAKPSFAMVIYPGYLTSPPGLDKLQPGIDPTATTPPTFLLQAENDPVHVENCLVYFRALKDLKVPTELHLFAEGGHGYGIRPTNLPVTHWPALAETWLHTIGMLPKEGAQTP